MPMTMATVAATVMKPTTVAILACPSLPSCMAARAFIIDTRIRHSMIGQTSSRSAPKLFASNQIKRAAKAIAWVTNLGRPKRLRTLSPTKPHPHASR